MGGELVPIGALDPKLLLLENLTFMLVLVRRVYVGDLAPPLLPLLHAPHLRTTQLRVTRVPQITSHEQRLAQIHAINYCCLLVQAHHVVVLHVHSDSHAGAALRRSQLLD